MLMIICMAACSSPAEKTLDTSADTGTPIDTEDSGIDQETGDTEEEGTDEDGDGFTVEEGDCNDSNPWTNPARDEEGGDGEDNDCDGRIDEIWTGLTVARQAPTGQHSILTFNTLGQIEDEAVTGEDCAPAYIDHAHDGGWIATVNGSILGQPPTAIAKIDPDGTCTVLHDFAPPEGEELPEGEHPFVRGIIAHPDGYYVATRMNELIKVDPDGTISQLASWSIDFEDIENFALMNWTLAIDLKTHEIALFGLYGGYGTYTPETGLVMHKIIPLENPDLWDGVYAYSGMALDGDTFHSLTFNSNTGETSISRFNSDVGINDFETVISWTPPVQGGSIFPLHITADGDHTEFYISANVATFHSLWRIRTVDNSIDDLFKSPSMPNYQFQSVVANYGVW